MNKFLSLSELAAVLGKSENSIRYHVRMGRITPSVRYGRVMGFDYAEVVKQLKRGVRSPQATLS